MIEDALAIHPAVALARRSEVRRPRRRMPVAYVQPKPGATVTEQELLEHAALTIPERAAIPKRIRISWLLPTTAVGKLFKPALVDREIEETIRAEADRVGAAVISVTVDRDPNVGLRAIVKAAAGAEKMKEALDRYTFRSNEVRCEAGNGKRADPTACDAARARSRGRVERSRTRCPAPVADGDQLELRCVVMTRFVRSRAAVMSKEHPDCLFNDLFGGDRQALATHHPGPQRELVKDTHELVSRQRRIATFKDAHSRQMGDDSGQGARSGGP